MVYIHLLCAVLRVWHIVLNIYVGFSVMKSPLMYETLVWIIDSGSSFRVLLLNVCPLLWSPKQAQRSQEKSGEERVPVAESLQRTFLELIFSKLSQFTIPNSVTSVCLMRLSTSQWRDVPAPVLLGPPAPAQCSALMAKKHLLRQWRKRRRKLAFFI